MKNFPTYEAINAPITCAKIKYITLSGWMPVKVFVNILEIVTSGFAKLVEDVNQ